VFFNGREDVCSSETAQRIRAAVSALRYTPNSLSRSLRLNATRTIGVCVGPSPGLRRDTRDTFVERISRGLMEAADTADFSLLLYPTAVRSGQATDAMLDGRVDGVVVSANHEDSRPAALAEAGMPTVVLTRSADLPENCGAVFADEAGAIDLALSHLWGLGHRRIAHLAGPVGTTDIARWRSDAYCEWMMARSAFDPALLSRGHHWEAPDAAEAVNAWRGLAAARPTAVFCANDSLALRVIAAARQVGWRVPEDLSVVGVDNNSAAAASDPPLTTVEIPAEEVGSRAVTALLSLIAGAPVEECRVVVPVTKLVTRASTAVCCVPN
jgi:LacI family transcriptional regulator